MAQKTSNVSARRVTMSGADVSLHCTKLCRVLIVLEKFTDQLPLVGFNSVSHSTKFFTTTAQTINTSIQENVTFNSQSARGSTSSASITIPYNVAKNLSSGNQLRLTHSVYSDDQLFASSPSTKLNSVVLATSIAGGIQVDNLDELVKIMFRKNEVN